MLLTANCALLSFVNVHPFVRADVDVMTVQLTFINA